MQLWLRIKVHALLAGYSVPATIGINPRPRCDTELTRREQCVFGDFAATVGYSRAAMPEISAHIQRALAAGKPGARTDRALHRRRSGVARRRRAACPSALVKRFRRERAGGSCDEYPFASTDEGVAVRASPTSRTASRTSRAGRWRRSTAASASSTGTGSSSRSGPSAARP
jgi:deoxyribonuclease NucA/NucB